MGNRSPGKIKREGRRAYANGADSTDNPYKQTWSYSHAEDWYEDWYEGWKEEQAYELGSETWNILKDETICCPHCGLKIRITKEGE